MNEVQELELLLKEFLGSIQEVLRSGEQLSDEVQGEIAKTLQALTDKIDLLKAEQEQAVVSEEVTPEVASAPPQLDKGPFPSSNVNSFKYDPRNQTLFVKFHGAETADSGPVYKYEGVPKNIYDVFNSGRVAPKTSGQNKYHRWIKGVTPSLGASLYALIRQGGYSYQRMS